MMWEISLNHQIVTVLLSVFMGAIFCLLYDNFKAVRLYFHFKTFWVFISDILFFVLLALIEFCFLLSRTAGEIRGFVLATELVGFFLCRYTLSKIYLKVLKLFLGLLNRIMRYVNQGVYRFSDFLWEIGVKILKKTVFSRKKG